MEFPRVSANPSTQPVRTTTTRQPAPSQGLGAPKVLHPNGQEYEGLGSHIPDADNVIVTWEKLDKSEEYPYDKVYKGPITQGKLTGRGTLSYPRGETYDGWIENGNPDGHGTMKWVDSKTYVGDFNKGLRTGNGLETLPCGEKFNGPFLKGKRHGEGSLITAQGKEKTVTYDQGVRILNNQDLVEGYTGHGTYATDPNQTAIIHNYSLDRTILAFGTGDSYTGDFLNGLPHGEGQMTSKKVGYIYKGSFVHGEHHGKGCMTFVEGPRKGKVYEGDFEHDFRTGSGTYTSQNYRYEGQFLKGEFHGQGTYIFNDGGIYKGTFENGQMTGIAVMTYSDGSKYEGEFVNDKRHGRGKETFGKGDFEGDIYEGEYDNDERTGYGKYTWKNGTIYEGNMVKGVCDGEGSFTFYQSGQICEQFTGTLKNGAQVSGTYQNFFRATSYTGQFRGRNFTFHGQGTLTFREHISYQEFTGQFSKGDATEGRMRFHNGQTMPGYLKKNHFGDYIFHPHKN